MTIKPGQLWPDAHSHVNAHCGDILKVGDRYYWFGEYRGIFDEENISCYASTDLVNWKFVRQVLTGNSDPAVANSHLERPKVIFSDKTHKYVMWLHRENTTNYDEAQCAVAQCDTVDGNYTWVGAFNPNKNMSRDSTLFKDDDGTAYFMSSSRDNADMIMYKLTPDYLKVDSQVGVLFANQYREAPCLFKRNGVYYLITSLCTGTWPNTQCYSMAPAVWGPWSPLKRLCDDLTWNTYYSQAAFVLTINGTQTTNYIYCGDRWQGSPMRHIWLPLQFNPDGSIAPMRWADEWTLDLATGQFTMPDAPTSMSDDLAKGAKVTTDYADTDYLQRFPNGDRSYSHMADHEPTAGNDGNTATFWCAADNDPGHWWQVDLGSPMDIDGTQVVWDRQNHDYKYRIEVSPDGSNWKLGAENGKGMDKFSASGVRYVRITITGIPSGYDWPGFAEFKVFSGGKNVALNKPATADSWQHKTDPSQAVSGNFNSAWTIDDLTANHWLKVDLGKPMDVGGCRILWEAPGYYYRYKVETSADDRNWTLAVDETKNKQYVWYPSHTFSAPQVRYVRLTITNFERGCWPGVRAFEIAPMKQGA